MTGSAPTALMFAQVDDLAFAAERGRLTDGIPGKVRLSACELGPFLELNHLVEDGLVPSPHTGAWLILNRMTSLYRAMTEGRRQWMCRETKSIGFLRTEPQPPTDRTAWTAFGLAAQKASVAAGFPRKVAGQLVGALLEMQSNIYEHSEAPQSGLLAFRAAAGVFEFVAADHGIGVLDSLRSGVAHADLIDHGAALELALAEGCSRFGDDIGRGMGFRPLFVGLANLSGELRFRSGDHALTINGDHPTLVTARLAQKPPISGFFAAIRCTDHSGPAY